MKPRQGKCAKLQSTWNLSSNAYWVPGLSNKTKSIFHVGGIDVKYFPILLLITRPPATAYVKSARNGDHFTAFARYSLFVLFIFTQFRFNRVITWNYNGCVRSAPKIFLNDNFDFLSCTFTIFASLHGRSYILGKKSSRKKSSTRQKSALIAEFDIIYSAA